MKIEMDKILVKAHGTPNHRDTIEYELVPSLSYCCQEMKNLLEDYSPFLKCIDGKLTKIFSIGNGDNADTYDYFPFSYCPFCGERFEYIINSGFIDEPIYEEKDVTEYKQVLTKKNVFVKLVRRKVDKDES